MIERRVGGVAVLTFGADDALVDVFRRRKLAFQECMEEIGLEVRSQLEVEGDHTLEGGMKAASVLATLPDRPSAVVCSNDMTAIGVMREVFDLSLSIPRDLSIIGFDDIRLGQFMTPPLTTVQLSQTEIANLAFAASLDSVEPQPNGSSRHRCTIETNLVLRISTALTPDRSGQRLGTRSPGTPR